MYVITGASGHCGRVVAEKLLGAGKKVRAIGRSAERLQEVKARGAELFICDLTERTALAKGFEGAEGVFVMLPPSTSSYRLSQGARGHHGFRDGGAAGSESEACDFVEQYRRRQATGHGSRGGAAQSGAEAERNIWVERAAPARWKFYGEHAGPNRNHQGFGGGGGSVAGGPEASHDRQQGHWRVCRASADRTSIQRAADT